MERKLKKGLIQVYTGEGKGKTTASLGLSMRAAGQGLKVYILQLLKPQKGSSGEVNIASELKEKITIERLDTPWWSFKSYSCEEDIARLKKILKTHLIELEKIVSEGAFDLVIIDEINNCLHYNFIEIKEALNLMKIKHPHTELVFTGRYAPKEIIDRADLVTEMRPIKHPYSQTVKARRGIEF